MNHSLPVKCSVYVRNSTNGPACYYRVMQYVEELRGEPIEFRIYDAWTTEEYVHNLSRKTKWKNFFCKVRLYIRLLWRRFNAIKSDLRDMPDVVIISRELFPRYMPLSIKNKYEKLISNTKVLWDFDDDIYGNGEISKREAKILAEHAEKIVGIGEYNKTLIPYDVSNVYVPLPTTDKMFQSIRLDELLHKRKSQYDREVHLVWVGTVSNVVHIDLIIEDLEEAARILREDYQKALVLNIICNEDYLPKKELKWIHKKYIPWNREIVREELEKAHIGIMPLANNEYSKGKGGFKLIQYLSAGLPVMASEVGFNKEIVNEEVGYLEPAEGKGRWIEDLIQLSTDVETWEAMSYRARECYEKKFAFDEHLRFWKNSILEKYEN